MGNIHKLSSVYLNLRAGAVRSRDSVPDTVRSALSDLGAEVGRQILGSCLVTPARVVTPMGEEVDTVIPARGQTIVLTTKADHAMFGRSLANSLGTTKVGYMNFGGLRGLEALNAPIREIELPDIRGGLVSAVVIAKSCIATGCTAVSLAKTAMQEYMPKTVIFAAIFYSLPGLEELRSAFPHSEVFVVGEPDVLDSEGLLHPGIGILEARI